MFCIALFFAHSSFRFYERAVFPMLHSYDVTILGAGVIGCAIARALSRFDCSFAVPERAEDVCCGIFKANKRHHPRRI